MATNRIGAGTTTVGLNLLIPERLTLGRIALEKDVSMGALIRQLAFERLAQLRPADAAQLQEARRTRHASQLKIKVSIPTPGGAR